MFYIRIQCDGFDCSNELEIDEIYVPSGWLEYDDFHYCPNCAPQVKAENNLED